jgi:hypothetical protein
VITPLPPLTAQDIRWTPHGPPRLEDASVHELLDLDWDGVLEYAINLRETLRSRREFQSLTLTQNVRLTTQLAHARRELRRLRDKART